MYKETFHEIIGFQFSKIVSFRENISDVCCFEKNRTVFIINKKDKLLSGNLSLSKSARKEIKSVSLPNIFRFSITLSKMWCNAGQRGPLELLLWGWGAGFLVRRKNRGRFGVEHLELDLCFIDLGVHVL